MNLKAIACIVGILLLGCTPALADVKPCPKPILSECPKPAGMPNEGSTIGLILNDDASDYAVALTAGAAEFAGEHKLELRQVAGSAEVQSAGIDALIADGAFGFAVQSSELAALEPAIKRARDAGLAVVSLDSIIPDELSGLPRVATDDAQAGAQAGDEMVKALAGNQGKCMGFVGFLGAANAQQRIAGFRQAITGKGIELVDVRGDDVDFTRARSNVDDVLVANPDINCMVGFYSYNPPRIFEALRDAGKLGQITVVAFDEDPVTLGAVNDGSFASTIVQQPNEMGYWSMMLMASQRYGDTTHAQPLPELMVPTVVMNKDSAPR
ncbi:MAG TPA: substrate-binding domain-containing protein [Devosia sp.]|jgi:ribose transport system substrate-binding protein|uniref:substrate-binding domain-containing protein n=1 Tax=Devosia sp. TaxID=1871048 RepID=UPI002DDD7348|nr:substrate-binding domain-containing protein [Devosia sp.]HEV2514144.1 substrate-binding domain-containing protein [Devosia sp.]